MNELFGPRAVIYLRPVHLFRCSPYTIAFGTTGLYPGNWKVQYVIEFQNFYKMCCVEKLFIKGKKNSKEIFTFLCRQWLVSVVLFWFWLKGFFFIHM